MSHPRVHQIEIRANMVIADVKEHAVTFWKPNRAFECLHVAISFVIGVKKVNGDWTLLNLWKWLEVRKSLVIGFF